MCNRQGLISCPICQETLYCSVECQNKDEPVHRLLCPSSKNFNTSNPPPCRDKDWSYKRGILFGADADAPTWVWVKYKKSKYGYDENSGDFLGDDNPMPSTSRVQRNAVRGKQLKNTIDIIYRDEFGYDGSKPNLSIATAAHNGLKFMWRGNVVAMARLGLSLLSTDVVDMDLSSFRDVVDYFESYNGRNAEDFVARPGEHGLILRQIIPPASPTAAYTRNTR
jgi:hypothetical protein